MAMMIMKGIFNSIKDCYKHFSIGEIGMFINILFCACIFYSCKDDFSPVGGTVLSTEDDVVVFSDTFPLRSSTERYASVFSVPDSLMLGEIETNGFVYKCGILTQVACPIGYTYPQNATVDSAFLVLYYNSFFGDANTPLYITANFLDKSQLYYDKRYKTDIAINNYCSLHDSTYILISNHMLVPSQCKDTIVFTNGTSVNYLKRMRIRLNDNFTRKFFNLRNFADQTTFNNQFKGLYISTSFGGSTMLNIRFVALTLHYHFSYEYADTHKDTTVNDTKSFYANSEIKQINTCEVLNANDVVDSLNKYQTMFNFISSPIGVYTKLHIPMRQIQNKVLSKIKGKHPYINMSRIKLNIVTNSSKNNNWIQPARYLVMVPDTLLETYFEQSAQLTTTDYGVLSYTVNNSTDTTLLYAFKLDASLTDQLRNNINNDTLRLCLLPVDGVEVTDGNNQYTILSQIKPKQTLSNVVISSTENDSIPMVVEVVYSGF